MAENDWQSPFVVLACPLLQITQDWAPVVVMVWAKQPLIPDPVEQLKTPPVLETICLTQVLQYWTSEVATGL